MTADHERRVPGKLQRIPPRFSFSLTEALDSRLGREEIRKDTLPIGGILFNGGKSFLVLGADALNKVVVRRIDELPADFDPDQVIEGASRILDLSNFQKVQILQAGITGVRVSKYPSIKTVPSVGIAITAEDRETAQEGPYRIKEDEILQLFAGERGGIAVFSDYDLPEDNALLFERHVGAERHARLLFIKPSGTDQFVADSVEGVHQLLKNLNCEFLFNASLPLQNQAVKTLDKAIRAGRIDFHGSDVRAEIYRTHIIALARLAEITRDPKYVQQLEKALPDLHGDLITRIRNFGARPNISTEDVDNIINGLIKTRFSDEQTQMEIPGLEGITLTPSDTLIYNDLELQSSKILWRDLAVDRSYRSNNDVSKEFITNVINSMYDAKTSQEFSDLFKLIHALFESDYKKVDTKYMLFLHKHNGSVNFTNSSNPERNVIFMKDELLAKLTEFQSSALGLENK